MSGRTCMSLSRALTRRRARQPSTPGWAVRKRRARREWASRKAQLATVVRMSLPFRHRTTKKESRRPRRPTVAALEERTEGTTDRTEALEWLTTGLHKSRRDRSGDRHVVTEVGSECGRALIFLDWSRPASEGSALEISNATPDWRDRTAALA